MSDIPEKISWSWTKKDWLHLLYVSFIVLMVMFIYAVAKDFSLTALQIVIMIFISFIAGFSFCAIMRK